MKASHSSISKIKKILAGQAGYSPEKIPALYDKHNARCNELGLNRASAGQVCPYNGGFPV